MSSTGNNKVPIKTDADIAAMRHAGALVGRTLDLVESMIAPGVTTAELDRAAESFILENGAKPSFKGYMDYPATLCISIDDEVVHGIPGPRQLRVGMIVSVDVGVYVDGYHGDSARTFPVGKISDEASGLLRITREALYLGVSMARDGNRVGDISAAVQAHAEQNGLSVVRDLVGHGIGRSLHEPPQVPNFGLAGQGVRLRKGMTLAIEPMVNTGKAAVRIAPDKWTVRTEDGSLSAHFEHTVVISENGPDIVTYGQEHGERAVHNG